MKHSPILNHAKIFLQGGLQYLSNIKTQLILTVMLFYISQVELLETLHAFEFPKIEVGDYFHLIRPYGWISNFVSIGFGLLLTNAWISHTPSVILDYLLAGVAIGPLLWGGLYTFNSVFDAEFDQIHPTKMYRPIAAGRISKKLGLFIATVHLILGLSLIAFVSPVGLFLAVLMVGFQILYCFPPFRLKETIVNLFFSGPMNHFFRILIGWTLVLPLVDAPFIFLMGIVCILAIGYLSYKIQDKSVANDLGYRGLENYLSRRGVVIFDYALAVIASTFIFIAFMIHQITWHLLLFIPISFLIFIYIYITSSGLWDIAKPGIFIGKIHVLVIIFLLIEWIIIVIELLPFFTIF